MKTFVSKLPGLQKQQAALGLRASLAPVPAAEDEN
jgi:hypothetical protein